MAMEATSSVNSSYHITDTINQISNKGEKPIIEKAQAEDTVQNKNQMNKEKEQNVLPESESSLPGKKDQEAQLKAVIEKANLEMKQLNRGLEFSYHEDLHRVSVKVYDKDTKEVIKEIPSDEMLDLLKKLKEMSGAIIDQRG